VIYIIYKGVSWGSSVDNSKTKNLYKIYINTHIYTFLPYFSCTYLLSFRILSDNIRAI